MGSGVGAVSLIAGPVLFGVGAVLMHQVWPGDLPDYPAVNEFHDQNVVATHLVTLAFPFLVLSVVAIAAVARQSRRLAGAALMTSVFGLMAMLGNGILYSAVNSMAGIDDHETLDALTENLNSDYALVLWTFPLYLVGSVLLAAALWHSGAVPRWSAVFVGVGALIPVGILSGVGALSLVFAAIRLAGSIPVIRMLLAPVPD
jgi:hypothetical protein